MSPSTLFSFGYWGWGSATKELVEVVDAVEASRGFMPPIFVDIRVSRSVRAQGFDGRAFEKVVGSHRYRWMDGLGNLGVKDKLGMRIKDPSAASDLLDLAVDSAGSNRRLIFYCACEVPCNCHRSEVTRLAVAAAERRRLPIEIVEWPGGAPPERPIELELSVAAFERVRDGANSVPISGAMSLAEAGAIPWYSLLQLRPERVKDALPWRLVTGPVRYRKIGWYLPVYHRYDDEPADVIRSEQRKARREQGYEPQVVSV